MENIKVFDLILCILIFVIVCHFTFSSGITWTTFSYDARYIGRTCAPSETLFKRKPVYQPVTCGKMCYLDKKCIYSLYQPDTRQCIGCGYRPIVTLQTSHSNELQSSMHFANKDIKFDCTDILKANSSAASGVYEVAIPMKVYCDMTTDGGGWTVIHNRFDGSVDFNRNFSEYENGFGDINGEFWLGLKNIQKIAEAASTEFRLDVTYGVIKGYEKYSDFKLLDGTSYTLSIDVNSMNLSGITSDDTMSLNNGFPFSTYDREMDSENDFNCAEVYQGGWWFNGCRVVALNLIGKYCTPGTQCNDGVAGGTGHYHNGLNGLTNERKGLTASRMMIRLV